MAGPRVLVIGETPSLGRSIFDLLESEGVPCSFDDGLDTEGPLSTLHRKYPVVISACNEHYCTTAGRWAHGELPQVELVVIGDRDPRLTQIPGIRVVSLPLAPDSLVTLVNRLLAGLAVRASPVNYG